MNILKQGTNAAKTLLERKLPKSFTRNGPRPGSGTSPYTPHQTTTNPTGPAPYADDVGH